MASGVKLIFKAEFLPNLTLWDASLRGGAGRFESTANFGFAPCQILRVPRRFRRPDHVFRSILAHIEITHALCITQACM